MLHLSSERVLLSFNFLDFIFAYLLSSLSTLQRYNLSFLTGSVTRWFDGTTILIFIRADFENNVCSFSKDHTQHCSSLTCKLFQNEQYQHYFNHRLLNKPRLQVLSLRGVPVILSGSGCISFFFTHNCREVENLNKLESGI